MNNLPFIQPRKELYLNISVILIIIGHMSTTPRGKKNLNIEKLQMFYYLVNNPIVLNKVIVLAEKNKVYIEDSYFYLVDSISLDVDDLYDRDKIKILIKMISLQGYLSVDFNEDNGFSFYLNERGVEVLSSLNSNYFEKINKYVEAIYFLRSLTASKISGLISNAIR
jgi:hypothetical protein